MSCSTSSLSDSKSSSSVTLTPSRDADRYATIRQIIGRRDRLKIKVKYCIDTREHINKKDHTVHLQSYYLLNSSFVYFIQIKKNKAFKSALRVIFYMKNEIYP